MEKGRDTMFRQSVKRVRRGEIYWCDLGEAVGSEQGGCRPVIIVQNDIGNNFSTTTIVVPLTTKLKKTKLPTHHEFVNNGVQQVACAEQIRTVDKMRLGTNLGFVRKEDVDEISRCVHVAVEEIQFQARSSTEGAYGGYYRSRGRRNYGRNNPRRRGEVSDENRDDKQVIYPFISKTNPMILEPSPGDSGDLHHSTGGNSLRTEDGEQDSMNGKSFHETNASRQTMKKNQNSHGAERVSEPQQDNDMNQTGEGTPFAGVSQGAHDKQSGQHQSGYKRKSGYHNPSGHKKQSGYHNQSGHKNQSEQENYSGVRNQMGNKKQPVNETSTGHRNKSGHGKRVLDKNQSGNQKENQVRNESTKQHGQKNHGEQSKKVAYQGDGTHSRGGESEHYKKTQGKNYPAKKRKNKNHKKNDSLGDT